MLRIKRAKRSPDLLVAVVALAAGLAAGCGGDGGGGGPTTTEEISKEEFIERGDQLCREFRDAADPLERTGDRAISERDFKTLIDVTDELGGLAGETLEQFRSLPVPEGEEAAVNSYLDVQSRQIAVAEQLSEALRQQDVGELTALAEEVELLDEESDEIAQSIGFEVCGRD
jgi:hypothetical protein